MQAYRLLLRPRGRFAGPPRSSTLFGAFCWAVRALEGETKLKELLNKATAGEPPVVFSSAFPAIVRESSGDIVHFLPLPLSWLADKDPKRPKTIDEYTRQKYLKKKRYVTETLFASGKGAELLDCTLEEPELFARSPFLGTKEEALELQKIIGTEMKYLKDSELLHVSIDRVTNSVGEGLLYTEVSHFLGDRFALYSIVLTKDVELLKAACRYLSDTGIGPDRSTGRGHFEITVEERPSGWDWLSPPSARPCQFLSLSQYLPAEKELAGSPDGCFYNLEPVRSKVDSQREFKREDIWKWPVTYAAEGSVFTVAEPSSFYGWAPVAKELSGASVLQSGFTVPAFIKGAMLNG